MGVVSLEQLRAEREPHLSGRAICLACRHEWVAVAPIEVIWLECPACTLERGRFVGAAVKEDDKHWHCKCGNDLFRVTPGGYYCPNCGADQVGF